MNKMTCTNCGKPVPYKKALICKDCWGRAGETLKDKIRDIRKLQYKDLMKKAQGGK